MDLFTTVFGWRIVSKHFEHHRVHWNEFKLVLEVILVLVRPPIDIIRFNFDLERPVRLWFFSTVLIILSDLHNRSGANMISYSCEMLADGLPSTLVIKLSQHGNPAILEIVKGFLAVEGEHGDQVC